METKEQLENRLAQLETTHDQLISELQHIDRLMRLVGFTNGITGLKETAHEFHKNGNEFPEES